MAVVLDAEGLSTEQMQAIARWTNLSETTFLLPATQNGADYKLRIFTPRSELPFAGHPTLGSARAALEAGRAKVGSENRLVQECGAGLVEIYVEGTGDKQTLRLCLPPGNITPLSSGDVAELEACIGHDVVTDTQPAIVDVGAVWIIAQIDSPESLLALEPDMARETELERRLGVTGVTLYARCPDGQYEIRSFAPSCGVPEDPVCGSGNGAVALFQLDRGSLLPENAYLARQGRCVGRDGHVQVAVNAKGAVTIGGPAVTVVSGVLQI